MDDTTIDALREVLQDMTMAIELISSGERSGEALISFIEEMLKTIEAWAAKYNVILDDGIMAMESAQSSRLNPSPNSNLSSYPYYPVANPQVQATGSEVKDHLEHLDHDVKHLLDTSNQRRAHDQIEGEAHHQSVKSLNQDGDGNNEKGGEHLLHSQNDETHRDDRQVAGSSKAKPLRRVSRKTRSQVASTSVDGGPMHVDTEAKVNSPEPLIESPKLAEATPSGDTTSPSQASERKGDVVKSPDWLPKGWITEMKVRGTGGSAGSKDKYYFDPISNCRFRSKQEVLAFLGTTKRKRGRPRKFESKDEAPGLTNDAAQAESNQESIMSLNPELQVPSNTFSGNDTTPPTSTIATSTEAADNSMPTLETTKRRRGRPRKSDSVKNLSQTKDQSPGHDGASAQAGSIPELVKSSTIELEVPSNRPSNTTDMPPPVTASSTAASSGPTNSCIPMPHQSGQTSEWLVYESLASLPFPMFEHLRLVESNANKLANNNNSPPTLWPWMLGNAEGLKKPFGDTKPDESKLVEETKQDQNAPISSTGETQAAEVVPKRPKKAARKNAS